jgi:galactokinase
MGRVVASGQETEHAVREAYRRAYGYWPAEVVSVPGWLELLGCSGLGQEGLGLVAAVDRYARVAISRRSDGRVELVVGKSGVRDGFWLDRLEPAGGWGWSDRLKALLGQLSRRRVHYSGFEVALEEVGDGGGCHGLGGDGAMGVGILLGLRRLFPFTATELGAGPPPRRDGRGRLPELGVVERRLMIGWLRAAWARVGDGGMGLADARASLMGRAWQVMAFDGAHGTLDHFPWVGLALVVSDTGVQVDGERCRLDEEVKRECAAAAAALRARSLRSVDVGYLKANRGRLTERQYAIASHVVGEAQRVVYAERALREGDYVQVGHYMSVSDGSERDLVGRRSDEVEGLVGLARGIRGCLGVRAVGGGRYGSVVSVVDYDRVSGFLDELGAGYGLRTGGRLRSEVLQVVAGAG